MASLVHIAVKRKRALERLTQAMNAIAEQQGIEPVELPRKVRQKELLYALHLEALAEWAERIAGIQVSEEMVEPEASDFDEELSEAAEAEEDAGEVQTVNYERMNKAALVEVAVERGMDAEEANAQTKAELRDWLLASAAVTEDEQAAAEGDDDDVSED